MRWLTVLVVVTHLGLLLSERETSWFNGFVGDSYGFLGSRSGNTSVVGVFVDVNAVGVEARSSRGRSVYGVVVLRLEAFTVLTLGNVNRAGEGLDNVNVDVSISVFGARLMRLSRTEKILQVSDGSLIEVEKSLYGAARG